MITNYGFDRLKLSVSNYRLIDEQVTGLEPRGFSNGFRWFSNSVYALGISDGFCVVELFALWFSRVNSLSETWSHVEEFLDSLFNGYENCRMSRIDVFVDYPGKHVVPLENVDYAGKSKTKVGTFSGVNGTETSYLFSKSRSWTVRLYDKSKEIQENMTSHRYDEEYGNGILRIEAEYQKEYLKNLKDRSFENCIAYIIKHLKECRPAELRFLAERLSEEIGGGVIEYKARTAGQHTGQRTKERIYKALAILHEDFKSIVGDDAEFFAELAKLGKKRVSIHV